MGALVREQTESKSIGVCTLDCAFSPGISEFQDLELPLTEKSVALRAQAINRCHSGVANHFTAQFPVVREVSVSLLGGVLGFPISPHHYSACTARVQACSLGNCPLQVKYVASGLLF